MQNHRAENEISRPVLVDRECVFREGLYRRDLIRSAVRPELLDGHLALVQADHPRALLRKKQARSTVSTSHVDDRLAFHVSKKLRCISKHRSNLRPDLPKRMLLSLPPKRRIPVVLSVYRHPISR